MIDIKFLRILIETNNKMLDIQIEFFNKINNETNYEYKKINEHRRIPIKCFK